MGELINGRTPEWIKSQLKKMFAGCEDTDCGYCPNREFCDVADQYTLDLIDHLESERDAALAKVPKWISVEERLPKEAGKYIVCTRKKAVYCTAFRFFHVKGYFATDSTTHITHWMPLPEPPEGDA